MLNKSLNKVFLIETNSGHLQASFALLEDVYK
jgi:hypothetical protein